MFENEKEIQRIVDEFCEKKNINKTFFEVGDIAPRATGGKSKILSNNKSLIKNKECKYVIKYFKKLDLFIIWNYDWNKNMQCSLDTINEKLDNGINYIDQGVNYHNKKQRKTYFGKGTDLKSLLYQASTGF